MSSSRRNPFERALWIFAVVLIVVGIVGLIGLAVVNSTPAVNTSTCDSNGNCTQTFLQAFVGMAYSTVPTALSIGLGSIALAMGIRAIDVNARHRSAEHTESAPIAEVEESRTRSIVEPEPVRQAQGPADVPAQPRTVPASVFARPGTPQREPDPSIFMRPRD